METEQLGKRVAEHWTDNGRRRRTAVGFLVLAAIGLTAGVPLSIAYFAGPWGSVAEDPRHWAGSGLLPGGLVALGLVGLAFGLPLLVKTIRSKGECFEVYEQGIVHRVAGTASMIRWSDIVSVRLQGVERTGGPHTLGIDFQCVLRLTDHRRLKFNTFTTEAPVLAAGVDAAVNQGTPPKPVSSGDA
ncbi:MAG: hypothetical protein GEU98_08660 [Pseudonocardiaceae bacterium]|nr:hypothetical protein [Pseudonocardiaceae bacterium]